MFIFSTRAKHERQITHRNEYDVYRTNVRVLLNTWISGTVYIAKALAFQWAVARERKREWENEARERERERRDETRWDAQHREIERARCVCSVPAPHISTLLCVYTLRCVYVRIYMHTVWMLSFLVVVASVACVVVFGIRTARRLLSALFDYHSIWRAHHSKFELWYFKSWNGLKYVDGLF